MTIEKNRINRLFHQKGSLADHRKLGEYFAGSDSNEEVKEVFRDQWRNLDVQPEQEFDASRNFYKLLSLISVSETNRERKNRLLFRASQVAAILVVGILIAGAIYFSAGRSDSSASHPIQFYSHNGFRSQFVLPDGTTGWLGYNSTLKYSTEDNSVRTVELDGLAYFDVVHLDRDHPFRVETPSKLAIEVLGTRFNVASYSAENTCEIVLEQGSVQLSMSEKPVEKLLPNERIVYNISENTISKSVVKVDDFLAWKDGRLVLKDIPLEEACVKLSRFYNTDIELGSPELKDKKIRLVLEDETLDEALALIATLFPVKYEVVERSQSENDSFTKKKIILKLK
ncbi:FecR family protein [Mangrovibacterium diazotrophicum]|uniref:FecR family protein n=1 Tax=Mangrovibacterium diazotrophicum TaxID=1261403 RepID=A0A419VYC2_9BACT|nr:FecR domain-containing protein [Mangrovibacterium diazotrophicum]RKD88237.1 FecR family protein [Mangrovibacterium diazotrophicum]